MTSIQTMISMGPTITVEMLDKSNIRGISPMRKSTDVKSKHLHRALVHTCEEKPRVLRASKSESEDGVQPLRPDQSDQVS